MVAAYDGVEKKAYVIGIPRDSKINVSFRPPKINAAYMVGTYNGGGIDGGRTRLSFGESEKLTAAGQKIATELIAVQGKPADIGGYYHPDDTKATAAMRPSKTFNEILAML
jgi:anionic cell wall polymer biosynthesis LytR-Cps2A-Psr (LCP) family protein